MNQEASPQPLCRNFTSAWVGPKAATRQCIASETHFSHCDQCKVFWAGRATFPTLFTSAKIHGYRFFQWGSWGHSALFAARTSLATNPKFQLIGRQSLSGLLDNSLPETTAVWDKLTSQPRAKSHGRIPPRVSSRGARTRRTQTQNSKCCPPDILVTYVWESSAAVQTVKWRVDGQT